MYQQEMNLREERDFGQKFNAVFSFIQKNAKSFLKTILLLVGPPVLVGAIFWGIVYSRLIGLLGDAFSNPNAIVNSGPLASGTNSFFDVGEMLLANLLFGIASIWLGITVCAYIAEYLEGNRNISVEAVWKRGKDNIFPVIGAVILFSIVAVVGSLILIVVPLGPVLLRTAILVCLLVYCMVAVSLTVPVIVIEDESVFESIGRSFALIRGNWWATFGLIVVMGIVAGIATFLFAIPLYAVMIVSFFVQMGVFAKILTMAATCIMFAGAYLLSALPVLALVFQYFNLSEKKEGAGLLEKAEQIGKKTNTANEGEY
jgi:hypothetical protein